MNIIKLLHPFMPFITEEIYSYLPDKKDMLINESWPKYKEEWVFEKEEEKITLAIDAITSIRNARAELNIPPKKKSKMIFATNEDHLKESFEEMSLHFKTLASAEEIIIEDDMDELENAISLVKNQYKIFIPLEGLIDYQKELDRLLKDQKKNESELKRAEGKLNNESFVKKAPEKLVEEERKKIEKYRNIKMELEESIENLRGKINEL
ncbi:MAG: class I tRNA ligase family protein [Gallicola sp.]|nr:class I tRNA ligase family protein [Gallicola sp.]